jgi:predicted dehydrogenase
MTVHWGIVATGGIAARFASDVKLLPDAEVVAVGSRLQETAAAFAREHDVARAYATYQELVTDDEVDAVYVSTPHPGHHDATLSAIEAGKAVLVEKPFTMDGAEARALVAGARARGVFLMEAMWTRFLPHMVRLREVLASGALGEVTTVTAEHGQWFAQDLQHRLFAPGLGGGALLDLGIYPLSFASMVLGTPSLVTAASDPAFTGVDATTSAVLQHQGGAQAVVTCSLRAAGVNAAAVVGTAARVEIDPVWYRPTTMRVVARDGSVLETFAQPVEGSGHRFQAAEVGRCLAAGLLESPVMPLDETVAIMETMDEMRRQVGLDYTLL